MASLVRIFFAATMGLRFREIALDINVGETAVIQMDAQLRHRNRSTPQKDGDGLKDHLVLRHEKALLA